MTAALFDTLQAYKDSDDVAVRRNLCSALAAEGSTDAADVLFDLALKDEDAKVNAEASRKMAYFPRAQLQTIEPKITSLYPSVKGKRQLFNWYQIAEVLNGQTNRTLFQSAGGWWRDFWMARSLNRRLFWSRHDRHGALARLLNWRVWICMALALAVSVGLVWLGITDPSVFLTEDMVIYGVLSLVFLGLPLVAMFAPPNMALRRSVAGFGDALVILGVGLFLYILLAVLGGPGVEPILFYYALPLAIVRLALGVTIVTARSVIYPLMRCLLALGALVLVYYALLITLDQLQPSWYSFGLEMSLALLTTVPVSILFALHLSIRGTRPTASDQRFFVRAVSGVSSFALATVALGFIVVVGFGALLLREETDRLEIDLARLEPATPSEDDLALAELTQVWTAKYLAMLRATRDRVAGADQENFGAIRPVISDLEGSIAEVEANGIELYELDRAINELYALLFDVNIPFDTLVDLDDFSLEYSGLAATEGPFTFTLDGTVSKPIIIDVRQPVDFIAPSHGTLEAQVKGTRGGQPTDIVLTFDGVHIDRDPQSGVEILREELDQGTYTLRSELYGSLGSRETSSDEIISHLTGKVNNVARSVFNMDMGDTDQVENKDALVVLQLRYGWNPATPPARPRDGNSVD